MYIYNLIYNLKIYNNDIKKKVESFVISIFIIHLFFVPIISISPYSNEIDRMFE